MKFDQDLVVFGDQSFRGSCPSETAEQVTFFNYIREKYPTTIGAIAVHNRNEGKRSVQQTIRHKMEGMQNGSSDIIIPAKVPFVCELKRADHTKSRWQDNQINYLHQCEKMGAFACVALGHKGAIEALNVWLKKYDIE